MSADGAPVPQPVRVIVVANEKGGSGKSTVAIHVAVALLKRGHRVASIDLDTRQRTFTHYVENRKAWAQRIGRPLPTPTHVAVDGTSKKVAARALGERWTPSPQATIHRDRHARTRRRADAVRPRHGGHLDHPAQRQLCRPGRAGELRPRHHGPDRRQPLCQDRRGCTGATCHLRTDAARLDCAAQPPVDDPDPQQAAGHRRPRRAFAPARLPQRRGVGSTSPYSASSTSAV